MGVIAAFQTETGADFMACAIRAINAFHKSRELDNPLDQAEMMTAAVRMDHAAWLFFLAARELDTQVTFEEIQEHVLLEGPIEKIIEDHEEGKDGDTKFTRSYPVLFTDLVIFATLGVVDAVKKEK
tara:strand:+ start:127 stop:504 length:378 start_codon:yes stop_codon:yes gene_type:complete